MTYCTRDQDQTIYDVIPMYRSIQTYDTKHWRQGDILKKNDSTKLQYLSYIQKKKSCIPQNLEENVPKIVINKFLKFG